MRVLKKILLMIGVLGSVSPVLADVVMRNQPGVGSVIARKSGEEAQFIDVSSWRVVDVKQDLLAGDVLRTNASGQLALLFSDRTQVRLGRNTTLQVKQIGNSADTRFGLTGGTIWARAERGGIGLTVDTPAAAAAIRGTDWTMTVDGSGRTSLIVLEGLVQLSNEFGSVSVAEGEGAVASIGQAPTKLVIVTPKDREQMLFFLSVRASFNTLPASSLSTSAMRGELARIEAVPENARSVEDLVTLAEVALSYQGRQKARKALDTARRMGLSRTQSARLDLVEAMLAGAEGRYTDAAGLYKKAQPNLDPQRRAIAAYGGYFARSLNDPDLVEKPPLSRDGGPYAAVASALTAGFLEDVPAAIRVLRLAEQRYPNDPTLPAFRAQFALLIDDREQAEEAITRALEIDPDETTALEARAEFRSSYQGDTKGAYADLKRAAELAPGSTTIWNSLGGIESELGAEREAEAAFLRSIELDPEDPASRANLAIFYLDQGRLAEAKVQIDLAQKADPTFDLVLIALGRYYLQTGETAKGVESLLAASVANPGYAQAQLLLAAGLYENNERVAAQQAIENADRLDKNDPVTSAFRTAVAIDEYRSDDAIRYAQEALQRSRARGGDYSALSANKDAGSTLNNAYRLQGLDAWGRFYGDAVFDPFSAASYVDQAVSGSPSSFINDLNYAGLGTEPGTNAAGFSSFFQGLLLDPAMLSGRSRSANIIRRPFLEGSLGGGFISQGGDTGWNSEAEIQGYAATPIPISIYGKVDTLKSEEFRSSSSPGLNVDNSSFTLGDKFVSGTGYIALKPTPYDRVVAFVEARKGTAALNDLTFTPPQPIPLTFPGLPIPFNILGTFYDREVDQTIGRAGVAWSHTFGYRNVATVGVFGSSLKQSTEETGVIGFGIAGVPGLIIPGISRLESDLDQKSYIGAVNHTYGIDDWTFRYGVEGGTLTSSESSTNTTVIDFGGLGTVTDVNASASSFDVPAARAYFDTIYEVTSNLQLEAGLFGTYLGGVLDVKALEPRLGAAWAPIDGQYLRAAYLRETSGINTTTLAPVGVLGLQTNQLPIDPGGRADTFAARWDSEWNSRLFTSVDFQHQDITGLSINLPGTSDSIDIAKGIIDRLSATTNLWIGGGFGATASFIYSQSENRDPLSGEFGDALPFVPEYSGRVGLTYVNPVNVKMTLAATYIGERADRGTGIPLDDYWTADAFLTWEPFDKRFALDIAAYNLFDQKFMVDQDVAGWGRTVAGSLKIRF